MNPISDPNASMASVFNAWIDELGLADLFTRMDIAEEEIAEARLRHPESSDRLNHAFGILHSGLERMANELVYRSHCRELLDRVVSGADTRPGTDAEICCMMLEASQIAPLTSAAAGLYMRAFRAAGLPTFPELVQASEHHEGLEATRIDEYDQNARRKLTVSDRVLDPIECHGLHHGEPVTCAYAIRPATAGTGTAS